MCNLPAFSNPGACGINTSIPTLRQINKFIKKGGFTPNHIQRKLIKMHHKEITAFSFEPFGNFNRAKIAIEWTGIKLEMNSNHKFL